MAAASHLEMFAEVNTAHIWVFDNLGRLALRQHTTFTDDASAIANAQGFAYVVIGDEHADAALFEKTNNALNINDRNGIDASKRLIQKNKSGARG